MMVEGCLFTSFVTIQQCCCHPSSQYLLERLCFRLHQGPAFLRLSTRIRFN